MVLDLVGAGRAASAWTGPAASDWVVNTLGTGAEGCGRAFGPNAVRIALPLGRKLELPMTLDEIESQIRNIPCVEVGTYSQITTRGSSQPAMRAGTARAANPPGFVKRCRGPFGDVFMRYAAAALAVMSAVRPWRK